MLKKLSVVALLFGATPLLAVPGPADSPQLPPELRDAIWRHLESAVLSKGQDRLAVCFAPGTPQSYVEEVTQRYSQGPDPLFQAGPRWHELRGANVSPFQFPDGNRWTATASGGGLGQGDPTTLTWSYIPDGTTIPGAVGEPQSPSQLFAWLDGLYGSTATWQALFAQVFDAFGNLTGNTLVFQPTDDGAAFTGSPGVLGVRGDVRIGAHFIDGNSNILAYNFFPNTGDMVIDAFDSFYSNQSNNSQGFRNVLTHEHGHGLGISHVCPVQQTKLMEPFVSFAFDGVQHDDLQAAQRGYGDSNEHNDTFATATDLGSVSQSVTVSTVSIDDDSDVDFYSFDVGSVLSSVTLSPVGATYLNGPQNPDGSCTAGTSFNSLVQSNLGFDVIGTNGVTVLTTVNAGGLGVPETLTDFALGGPGTYFLRVFGSTNTVQLYQLELVGGSIFADGFESGNTAMW
ncbi:MAG: matrixin family metalloprotease [Thermoanaerobaculia bacterium]|nr:matrixin family metalloprotease [Thermoanaerobaculia bacterium]